MGGSDEVKLFGMWASPAVQRVEWALKMKGIEYELIEEDLSNKSPSLLEYNPINKQVPVLLHNGRPIVESMIIVEYIDDVWKDNPILPMDPYERARARFWASFADGKCLEASKKVFMVEGDERRVAIEDLEEAVRVLDGELKDKMFFGGGCIGFADIALGWMSFWLGVSEEVAGFKVVDREIFPSFAAWVDCFLGDPLIDRNLPPRSDVVEFFRTFRKIGPAAFVSYRGYVPKKCDNN